MTEEQSGTLVAQDHGNHPAVLQAAGFSTEHSAQARSIGYEEEVSPTLRAGVVPAAMSIQHNPTDSRMKIEEDGKVQTLCGRAGTGGNNVPLVAMPEPYTLKIRCGKAGGGKGALWQRDKSATLAINNDQTLFQPKDPAYAIGKEGFQSGEKANFNFPVNEEVAPTMQASGPSAVAKPEIRAYGVCSKSSHAMLSDNPHSGFYEAKTSRTLDKSGGNAVTSNQGGICVVAPDPAYALQGSMIGRKEKNGPQGDGINEDVSFTLTGADRHAVAQPTYCATTGSYMEVTEEKSSTLMARDYKDPKIINEAEDRNAEEPVYIVRRLTPVECARLQGFPDWWCADLAIPEPSDAEIAFWTKVWETWDAIQGKKPKTEKQIRKWLADPYTDAAEYKLWGNGICLNNAFFVLAGIAWAAEKEAVTTGEV